MSEKHLTYQEISLLCDEMLPKKTSEEYHRHIVACPDCEAVYDEFQAMSFAMVKLEEVAPPQGYAAFTEGIMANLPPQDKVNQGETVEIKSHVTKQNPLASLQWQHGLGIAACLMVMSSFFTPSPVEENYSEGEMAMFLDEGQGVSRGIQESEELDEGIPMMSDAVSSATQMVQLDLTQEEWDTLLSQLSCHLEEGVVLKLEQEEELAVLTEMLRSTSQDDSFFPDLLVFAQMPPLETGSWGRFTQGETKFYYTTREYDEISHLLEKFPSLTMEEEEEYLLIAMS